MQTRGFLEKQQTLRSSKPNDLAICSPLMYIPVCVGAVLTDAVVPRSFQWGGRILRLGRLCQRAAIKPTAEKVRCAVSHQPCIKATEVRQLK
jgi:hypothetical protein